jgi:hypothetical protein
MPAATGKRHERTLATPFTVSRHSKQMPMPQSGPRGSPRRDRRVAKRPLASTAAATLEPASAAKTSPSMRIAIVASALKERSEGPKGRQMSAQGGGSESSSDRNPG